MSVEDDLRKAPGQQARITELLAEVARDSAVPVFEMLRGQSAGASIARRALATKLKPRGWRSQDMALHLNIPIEWLPKDGTLPAPARVLTAKRPSGVHLLVSSAPAREAKRETRASAVTRGRSADANVVPPRALSIVPTPTPSLPKHLKFTRIAEDDDDDVPEERAPVRSVAPPPPMPKPKPAPLQSIDDVILRRFPSSDAPPPPPSEPAAVSPERTETRVTGIDKALRQNQEARRAAADDLRAWAEKHKAQRFAVELMGAFEEVEVLGEYSPGGKAVQSCR